MQSEEEEFIIIKFKRHGHPLNRKSLEKTVKWLREDPEHKIEELLKKLNQLSFNNAIFKIELIPSEPSVNGNESIQFLVSTFKGAELQPIQKVLSGGELSRISLAIQVVTAQYNQTPSIIFDEIDVGVGGKIAEMMISVNPDSANILVY
mgnify:CR=1 FL=1